MTPRTENPSRITWAKLMLLDMEQQPIDPAEVFEWVRAVARLLGHACSSESAAGLVHELRSSTSDTVGPSETRALLTQLVECAEAGRPARMLLRAAYSTMLAAMERCRATKRIGDDADACVRWLASMDALIGS